MASFEMKVNAKHSIENKIMILKQNYRSIKYGRR